MKFKKGKFSNSEKISGLQRWIIVQSYLYYKTNLELVSNKMYDDNCIQLVQMQKDYPKASKKSDYYYVFYDFDGTTGFDLWDRLDKADKKRLREYIKHIYYRYGGATK